MYSAHSSLLAPDCRRLCLHHYSSKKAWLIRLLRLPNGLASHDTFGRVYALTEHLGVLSEGRAMGEMRGRNPEFSGIMLL